jgi:hypothetical protein
MRTGDVGRFVGPDDGKELMNPLGGRMAIKVLDEYHLHNSRYFSDLHVQVTSYKVSLRRRSSP